MDLRAQPRGDRGAWAQCWGSLAIFHTSHRAHPLSETLLCKFQAPQIPWNHFHALTRSLVA